MAFLIDDIAIKIDFEQWVNDTTAFVVATVVDIECTQSDNMRRLIYSTGNDLIGSCCIYTCNGDATVIEWNDVIAISVMHSSGLFGDGSEIHRCSPVIHGDNGMPHADSKTASKSETEIGPR
jgi:hypothetical protein